MAVESWNARLFRNEMRAEWWPKITVCIVVYIPPPFLRPVTNSSRHHTSVLRDFHHPPILDYVSAQTSTFLKNFQLFFKNKTKSNLIFIWPYSFPARFELGSYLALLASIFRSFESRKLWDFFFLFWVCVCCSFLVSGRRHIRAEERATVSLGVLNRTPRTQAHSTLGPPAARS